MLLAPQSLSAGSLHEQLADPALRILDVRLAEAYADGHIPGASHLDLNQLRFQRGGVDGILLGSDAFASVAGQHGISANTMVVVYDDNLAAVAPRVLWSLHYYGHEKLAILDGGWDQWEASGYAISDRPFKPQPSCFQPQPRVELLADLAYVQNHLDEVVLLDTRSQAEFDKGHLPGALLWNWENGQSLEKSFTNGDALLDFLLAQGVSRDHEIITYCQSGVRASHTFYLLKRLGFAKVRLYDGSWAEWSQKVVT